MVTKTSHLPIRYFLALLWAHPILHISTIRVKLDLFVCFWRDSTLPSPSQSAMASSFTRFLDHTQRHTTVGRTPLDEGSARRRDLYQKTHNSHKREIPTLRRYSKPQSQQANGHRPTPQTSRPLRPASGNINVFKFEIMENSVFARFHRGVNEICALLEYNLA